MPRRCSPIRNYQIDGARRGRRAVAGVPLDRAYEASHWCWPSFERLRESLHGVIRCFAARSGVSTRTARTAADAPMLGAATAAARPVSTRTRAVNTRARDWKRTKRNVEQIVCRRAELEHQ